MRTFVRLVRLSRALSESRLRRELFIQGTQGRGARLAARAGLFAAAKETRTGGGCTWVQDKVSLYVSKQKSLGITFSTSNLLDG